MKYTEFYRDGRPVGPAARLRVPAGATQAYDPGERDMCISIRDPAAPLPVLGPQFFAVLSLEFDDDRLKREA